MGFSLFYTIFFWLTWIIFIPIILKAIPIGTELIYMVVYSIVGTALYFLIPNLITERIENQQETKYQERDLKAEARRKFLDEQRLRKQYRYIKLNKKENIIAGDIDNKDKIALLGIAHGYTPEAAAQIIEEYQKKKGAA